ncbi:MAG: hypothetical protein QOH50_4787 [Kribbellaceae bacterium]|jgi:hypothetical protein|nr:hypothetical protein [Kribbellaceae bacterium]
MRRTPSPDSAGFTLSAWVDESVIVGWDGRPGVYTLAAVVADSANCDDIRDRLRALTLSRGGRLHWVDESSKRRDVIAAAIADIDLAAIVTIGSPMDKTKQERARRCCLERLLYELGLLEARSRPSLARNAVSETRSAGSQAHRQRPTEAADPTRSSGRLRPAQGGADALASRCRSRRSDCGEPRGVSMADRHIRDGHPTRGRGSLESAKAGSHPPVGVPASLLIQAARGELKKSSHIGRIAVCTIPRWRCV